MKSGHFARRLALVAGGSALIAMGALTAGCSSSESPAPSSTSTTTTTSTTSTTSVAPSSSPTEKSLNPSDGNSFTPPITAPAAPTGQPGNQKHTN